MYPSTPNPSTVKNPTRRSVVRGAAWTAPAIAVASSVPAVAASYVCRAGATMDWRPATTSAGTNPLPSPTTYTIAGAQTIYARVTHTTTATTPRQTWGTTVPDHHLDIGKTAWGQVTDASGNPPAGVRAFSIATTGGANDLVMNHRSGAGNTVVTIEFFKDAAMTRPHYVENLQVPLDDFSTQRSYSGLFTPVLNPAKSYQEMWTVTGNGAAGAVTPQAVALQNPYNTASTLANVAGNGTAASPWNFPTSLTSSSRNQVGGNLITRFNQPVNSVTVTYGSSSQFTGPQGAGLGRLTMCA